MSQSRKHIRVLEDIATGRRFAIPEGADEPEGATGQPEIEVPEGYRLVSDEAFTNLKGAADRKLDAARIARENKLLRSGVPAEVLESDEGKALLNSQGIDEELLVVMAKKLAGEPAPAGEEEGTVTPDPTLSEGEDASTAERQALATGSSVTESGGEVDPYSAAHEQFKADLAAGGRKEVALGNAIGVLMQSNDARTFIPEDAAWDPMSSEVGVGYEGR